VIGIDISADQLRMARRRSSFLALASALHLPFADESFDTVTTTYLHTDIDSMAPVFVEAYRVLRKRGTFVYLGTHPCFIGHFIEIRDDGARVIHPGYHQNGWHTASPFFRAEGLGIRVGFRHVPLTELVNSLLACGLQLVRLEEPSVEDPPGAIALVATKE
jgi:SAM-dependent methyltransferase